MACCGKKAPRHQPVDRHGNGLKKYAYLNPNQIAIRDAEEEKDKEE